MFRQKSKVVWLVLIAFGLAICPACIVRSVEPWLKKESIVFESDLLGGWIGTDFDGKAVAMTFISGENQAYVMQYSSKDGQGTFEARLAKFGSDYYLDFVPREDPHGVDGWLFVKAHTAARLELGKDRMTIQQLDYGQFKAAAKLERLGNLKVSWDGEDELVVISPTEDLQRFLLSLDRNSILYMKPIRMRRSD